MGFICYLLFIFLRISNSRIFLFVQIIAAITYQIVPADTQYAEIPLAAVSSAYQHKVSFAPSTSPHLRGGGF